MDDDSYDPYEIDTSYNDEPAYNTDGAPMVGGSVDCWGDSYGSSINYDNAMNYY